MSRAIRPMLATMDMTLAAAGYVALFATQA
jgi:hypothetical protein